MEKTETSSKEVLPKPSKIKQLLSLVKQNSLVRKVGLAGTAVLMAASGGEVRPTSSPGENSPAPSPIVVPGAVPTPGILVQVETPPSPVASATPRLPDLIQPPVETPVPEKTIIPLPTFDITKSVEVKIPNKILDSVGILDIAPTEPNELVRQTEFLGYKGAIRQIMGNRYSSFELLEKEYGPDALHPDKWSEVFQKYPEAAHLYNFFTLLYKDHGIEVAKAVNKAGIVTGAQGRPFISPLEKLFTPDRVRLNFSSSRKSSIRIDVSPEAVTKAIQDFTLHLPGKTKVGNMSFQVGTMGADFYIADKQTYDYWSNLSAPLMGEAGGTFYYFKPAMKRGEIEDYRFTDDNKVFLKMKNGEEVELRVGPKKEIEQLLATAENEYRENTRNTSSEIIGSYLKETAVENVGKLVRVAQNVKDQRIFLVAASGNWGDDLREVRDLLAAQSNMIVSGEWTMDMWGDEMPAGYVYGAEVYVPNWQLGLGAGSSFSTPVISSLTETLLSEGVPYEKVKETIFADFCIEKPYGVRSSQYETKEERARVLDLQKVQDYFKNR